MYQLLQKELKSRKRDVRYSAIDQLVEQEGEKAFPVLKTIAEGENRTWLKRYGFDDQVYVMYALLKTGGSEILQYLEWFFEESVKFLTEPSYYGDEYAIKWTVSQHTFPNSSGELGQRLFWSEEVKEEPEADHSPDAKLIVPYDAKAHNVRESILNRVSELKRES